MKILELADAKHNYALMMSEIAFGDGCVKAAAEIATNSLSICKTTRQSFRNRGLARQAA
jgi:hypothetical protein